MNILVNLISSLKNKTDHFHGGNEYSSRICIEVISVNKSLKHNLFFFCDSEEFIDQNLLTRISEDKNCTLIKQKDFKHINEAIHKLDIQKLFDPLGVEIGQYSFENLEVIYTIHGLRPIEMPTDINEYYLESKIKHLLKTVFPGLYRRKAFQIIKSSIEFKAKSKTLIVVSNHTKYSIVSEFNVDPGQICVLYSPEKIFPTISDEAENSFFDRIKNIEKADYFLIVSSKRWIKNTYRAIRAFDELINLGLINHKIILTGANEKVKQLIRNKKWFLVLDYVDAGDLETLYKNAFALVYPSLNEGFGYPPLEAMKYGTPVISAAITSIPEVVGDASLSFNPMSVIELKARLLQLQNDKKLYDSLVKKGLRRYSEMSKKQQADLREIVDIILS